jgi:hypothetical protein
MAAYMIELLSDHQRARAMGKAGREHIIANYNQGSQIGRLYELAELSINQK